MKNNPILEKFQMESNPIDHEDDIDQLCEIIKVHPAINTIQLDDCFDEEIDGHKILCSIMTAGANKLKSIDLSRNGIAARGSTFIADFLATNPLLEELALQNNDLNDEDAISIARALKHNTNLRLLDVRGNDITDAGWDTLRTGEFDSMSLNSAADSNHTCYISPVSKFNGNTDIGKLTLYEPKQVRQKKVYRIISSRNRKCSNVKHFDGVPVELLPEILTSIQQYSEYHLGDNAPPKCDESADSLSVVYEIMRWWDKSVSVYESLGS